MRSLSSVALLWLLSALLCAAAFPALGQGAGTVWEHFTYDNDVTTSSGGNGPAQAKLQGVGPRVSHSVYRFGKGSAFNPQPDLDGEVLIVYDRQPAWSIAFWLFITQPATDLTPVFIPTDQGEFVFQLDATAQLDFVYENGVLSNFGGYTIIPNQWTHFVVTGTPNGASNIDIIEYVNAQSVQTYTQSTTQPPGPEQYAVLESGGYNFDELWIINSAINPQQVQELYQSNKLP